MNSPEDKLAEIERLEDGARSDDCTIAFPAIEFLAALAREAVDRHAETRGLACDLTTALENRNRELAAARERIGELETMLRAHTQTMERE